MSYTNISASGQPGGVQSSSSATFINQAGFLNTFFLRPGLDTDHDGLPDEIDNDNDNDGLVDGTELDGASFSPATATLVNVRDTDGDGVADGAEASAGTDPTDPNAALEIIAFSRSGSARAVSWPARGQNQRTYRLLASDGSPTGRFDQVLFSNRVAGGTAPWFAVTNTVLDAAAPAQRIYAVEVVP